MAANIFTWCPLIALLVGVLCTLGFFRSRSWGTALVTAAFFVQVLAWTIFVMACDIRKEGWMPTWQGTLEAAFAMALLAVVPYTAIGAVCGGVLIALVRVSVRQEVEQAEEEEEEAEEREHMHEAAHSGDH